MSTVAYWSGQENKTLTKCQKELIICELFVLLSRLFFFFSVDLDIVFSLASSRLPGLVYDMHADGIMVCEGNKLIFWPLRIN